MYFPPLSGTQNKYMRHKFIVIFLNFSLIYAVIYKLIENFTSLGLKRVLKWSDLRRLEENHSGETANIS